MTVAEAKVEYNKLLQRYYKAIEWFDREDISQTEKEKFLPSFQEILKGLNYLLGKIEIQTKQEIMEGFHGNR